MTREPLQGELIRLWEDPQRRSVPVPSSASA
jgi:hypothetical protein